MNNILPTKMKSEKEYREVKIRLIPKTYIYDEADLLLFKNEKDLDKLKILLIDFISFYGDKYKGVIEYHKYHAIDYNNIPVEASITYYASEHEDFTFYILQAVKFELYEIAEELKNLQNIFNHQMNIFFNLNKLTENEMEGLLQLKERIWDNYQKWFSTGEINEIGKIKTFYFEK